MRAAPDQLRTCLLGRIRGAPNTNFEYLSLLVKKVVLRKKTSRREVPSAGGELCEDRATKLDRAKDKEGPKNGKEWKGRYH